MPQYQREEGRERGKGIRWKKEGKGREKEEKAK